MAKKTNSKKSAAAPSVAASNVEQQKPVPARARKITSTAPAAKPAVAAPEPAAKQPVTTPAPKAPVAATPLPRASDQVDVTFALIEPHAQRVTLCGGFNAWSPDATPMNRRDDGIWEARLPLPPGRYEYKFMVDGQWLPDPQAHENQFNGFGTLNSVIDVRN